MVLTLKKGIIYGPVNSRRYGKSLGINLMPVDYKLCSFDCVYCHYGYTKICTGDVAPYHEDLPRLEQVVAAVEQALTSESEFQLITFSGNGESTLHPQFPEMVTAVAQLRNRYRPEARLALLSNASGGGTAGCTALFIHYRFTSAQARCGNPRSLQGYQSTGAGDRFVANHCCY